MKKAYTTENGAKVKITTERGIDGSLENKLDTCIENLADQGYENITARIYKDQKDRICYQVKARKKTKEGTNVLEMNSTYFSGNVNLTSVHYGGLTAGERCRLLAGPRNGAFRRRLDELGW